jgi:hypothetical protein
MSVHLSATVVTGALAVTAAAIVSAAIGWRASRATIEAGFWWDDAPFVLSVDDAAKIGGPLSATELATIRTIARADVERAFADLRIRITDNREAFWRVTVVGTPAGNPTFKYPFAAAGESHVFGPLGSWGSVGFLILAHNAIEYAPPSASRAGIVAGIGHGIGRAAVHEFAHQALGTDNLSNIDNRSDEHSYEFGNADRPAQYYGDLRWTAAWPVLEQKFGRR